MNVNSFVNQFKSAALSVGEYLTPVLRASKFKETGVLTPEEFVAAGDHLVHLNYCALLGPGPKQVTRADQFRTREYLPANKQFLLTRQVPCHQRCSQMMNYDESKEKIIKESGIDGGEDNEWVDTHFDEAQLVPRDLEEEQTHNPAEQDNAMHEQLEEELGEALDLDEFVASGALEEDDPGRYVVQRNESAANKSGTETGAGLMKTRRYDLHITYDKYYQVPRFWLVGYDENGTPLSVDKMKEDFSQEHADRTITLESHPHIDGLTLATIHPCRHAAVMKRLIEQFQENGKELNVLDYILVFLKFVQAVIPTVEYDYTRSIRF